MRARLLLTALVLPLVADAPSAQGFEPGAAAPPGRWTLGGGCASGTGRSLSAPVRAEPVEAWTVTVRGEIEGEPLVWDGTVILSVKEAPTRRALHLLELETGRTLLHRVLPAELPLEASVWGDRIAVRPALDRVDVYRTRGSRLQHDRTLRAEVSISPPVFHEGELYLRLDGELARYDLSRRDAVWSTGVRGGFRGRPALRGENVFGLWYEPSGRAMVARLTRTEGRAREHVEAGHHGGVVPGVERDATLFVHETNVFVHYPLPVPSTGGASLDFGRVARRDGRFTGTAGGLYPLVAPPVPWLGGWIAPSAEDDGPRWLASRVDGSSVQMTVLADHANHPELLDSRTPASLAREVLYLGPIAADLTSYEILWRRKTIPRLRPVPAAGMLLVVEGAGTLVALREPPPLLDPAGTEAALVADRLEEELADGYAGLAHQSVRLGDAELTGRLVAEAVRLGARGRMLEAAQDGLDRLLGLRRTARIDARRLAAVEAEEQVLLARPAEELLLRARRTGDARLRRAFVRELLARYPGNAEGTTLVREMLPEGAPVAPELAAPSWLDFLDVEEYLHVRFVHPDDEEVDRDEAETLAREGRRWRTDVSGYRSESLYVITPPGRPGAVARCLEVGELLCEVLDEIFPQSAQVTGREPMTLLLYPTEEVYVEQSRRSRSGPETALGWTAGHYSGTENLSRMYVPEDDAGLRALLGVYAHELTHHWLATRAPFARAVGDADLPGYWIAEGFAVMLEEFVLRPEAGEWSPENPRAGSLDAVANARPDQMLPWEDLLASTFRQFSRMDPQPHTSVPLTWRLGVRAEKSEMQMFYAQAGALCHYLFNASPEMRARLSAYVSAWYEGDKRGVRPDVFGIAPEELGARVVEYARETVSFD